MRIIMQPSEGMDNWYRIVRAEHDGHEWLEKVGANSYGLCMSERLSPEACIEGNAGEMIELAKGIKKQQQVTFKRCAVRFEADGVHFYSPKNSKVDGVVSIEEANELANQILNELEPPNDQHPTN